MLSPNLLGKYKPSPAGASPAHVPAHVLAHVLAHAPAHVQGSLWQGSVCTFQEYLDSTRAEHLLTEKLA